MRKHNLVLVGSRLVRREQLGELQIPPETPVYDWQTLPPQPDEGE
jgi:hypothetical protein